MMARMRTEDRSPKRQALLVVVPRFASYAASMLMVVMLGAIWTVVPSANETGLGPGIPTIHIAVLSIILYARWGRRWRSNPASTGEAISTSQPRALSTR